MYTMGERIRQAREDMGYTRETFSEMANITPRFCYDIESGKKGVSIDTLKNICEALNLSADHLLDLKPLDIAMVFTGLCPHMSSLFQKH